MPQRPHPSPRSRRKAFALNPAVLQAAEASRGKLPYNLWYVYSPTRQDDLVLPGDLDLAHFYALEGDPRVVAYDLHPPPVATGLGERVQQQEYDALVTLRSGPPELRSLGDITPEQEAGARAIAKQCGFDYQVFTWRTAHELEMRIANWRIAVACLSTARAYSIGGYANEILVAATRFGRGSVRQLLVGTAEDRQPLYLAALFSLLRQARLASDFDERPLCLDSTVWLEDAK